MADYDPQEHRRVLERILRAEPSMRQDIQALGRFPFDVAEPLVLLTLDTTRDVLARHAQGHIADDDLEAWADALEVRYDVEPEPTFHEALKECLFELSEPLLTGKPMAALAAEWREQLSEISAH
jgi:hypothetical protein